MEIEHGDGDWPQDWEGDEQSWKITPRSLIGAAPHSGKASSLEKLGLDSPLFEEFSGSLGGGASHALLSYRHRSREAEEGGKTAASSLSAVRSLPFSGRWVLLAGSAGLRRGPSGRAQGQAWRDWSSSTPSSPGCCLCCTRWSGSGE